MGARIHRSHAFDALQMRFPVTEYVASLAMVQVTSLHSPCPSASRNSRARATGGRYRRPSLATQRRSRRARPSVREVPRGHVNGPLRGQPRVVRHAPCAAERDGPRLIRPTVASVFALRAPAGQGTATHSLAGNGTDSLGAAASATERGVTAARQGASVPPAGPGSRRERRDVLRDRQPHR